MTADLKDPLAHQVALDQASLEADTALRTLLSGAEMITGFDNACDTANPPQQNPESGQRQEPASSPCPAGLEPLDFGIDLKIISFSVQLRGGQCRGGHCEGWLEAFVNATHNFKNGSTTIFAGAQAGAKLPGPLGHGGNFRSGAYVTIGSMGSVEDVGMRVGHSTSLAVGALSVSNGAQMDFSFVGVSSD